MTCGRQPTGPRTVGGGPLFGVNAPVILGHGSCLANGVEGAIRTAVRYVDVGLLDIMRKELAVINNSDAGSSASPAMGKAADAAN